MKGAKFQPDTSSGTIVALCGGIGGAKLALGLSLVIPDERLLIGVNTGDDFEHLGLHVSPDIDTVTYTLAGVANPDTGWGRADESWNFMEALTAIGGPSWFSLGDRDLALNVERTHRLRAGEPLSAITRDICSKFGISVRIVPMSDEPVRTLVDTDAGPLPFQNYFVERQCAPFVRSVVFAGADNANVQSGLMAALLQRDLRAVIICPSNPYLSVDPILSLSGMREALQTVSAPVIAVSPVVNGDAVKGPMAKIMGELGLAVTHATIAEHYAGLIDGLMVDGDGEHIAGEVAIMSGNTMMKSLDDKVSLARDILAFADQLATGQNVSRERIA
jgi:LPPG:FO 2-phospho-L-lactate transferase